MPSRLSPVFRFIQQTVEHQVTNTAAFTAWPADTIVNTDVGLRCRNYLSPWRIPYICRVRFMVGVILNQSVEQSHVSNIIINTGAAGDNPVFDSKMGDAGIIKSNQGRFQRQIVPLCKPQVFHLPQLRFKLHW